MKQNEEGQNEWERESQAQCEGKETREKVRRNESLRHGGKSMIKTGQGDREYGRVSQHTAHLYVTKQPTST